MTLSVSTLISALLVSDGRRENVCIDPLLYVITGGPVIEGHNRIFVNEQ